MRGRYALVLVLAAACSGTDEAPPELKSIEPRQAYNDDRVPIMLTGGPFRPTFTIDTNTGAASLSGSPFAAYLIPTVLGLKSAAIGKMEWRDDHTLAAEIPARIPDGLYDVQVRDPRGNSAMLRGAFRSLGADVDVPTVVLRSPPFGAYVAADSEVNVVISAEDGNGRLRRVGWELSSAALGKKNGSCDLPDLPRATECHFSFVAPRGAKVLEDLTITANATDTVGHTASETATIHVAWTPIAVSFSPMTGPAYGMTQITVRGQGFVKSTRVLMGGMPIEPNGGLVDGDTSIRGWTLPHEPGVVEVSVATGNGVTSAGSFEFVASPVIRDIFPTSGPSVGGNIVTIVGSHFRPSTRFFAGADLTREELTVIDLVSSNRIRAFMPPGIGLVSLFAVDLITGDGDLPDAYTYTDEPPP
ncbi:MAG TPA: IPT/TIG domain-containing protein [Polyangia bacterium]|nr:IPT/TIG domain-containing protein [Polyangia bacterium]